MHILSWLPFMLPLDLVIPKPKLMCARSGLGSPRYQVWPHVRTTSSIRRDRFSKESKPELYLTWGWPGWPWSVKSNLVRARLEHVCTLLGSASLKLFFFKKKRNVPLATLSLPSDTSRVISSLACSMAKWPPVPLSTASDTEWQALQTP